MIRFFPNLLVWILGSLSLASFAVNSTASESPNTIWYTVTLGGQQTGWVRLQEIHEKDEIHTEIEQKMSFRRGPSESTVELYSQFKETSDGRPISASAKQLLGGQERQAYYEFTSKSIQIRTSVDGPITDRQMLPDLPWSTPLQSQQRLMQALKQGEKAFSVRTIDPNLGSSPVEIDWLLQATEIEISAAGRTWTTSRWEQRQSWAPQLVTLVYLDAEGLMIRTETELFGMSMVQTLAAEDPSKLAVKAAPEMLIPTFIQPDRAIRKPRQLRKATFDLISEQPLPHLPQTSAQSLAPEAPQRITVDVAGSRTDRVDPERYLASTAYFDYQDEAVQSLLDTLHLPENSGKLEVALALRQLVNRQLTSSDLNSIFDTASEVARQRSGDCTEHSVLLTALLRAAGIPARAVVGLIYADEFLGQEGVFVYHMWSQAWIDQRWVDLDATLRSHTFDATHIALQLVHLEDSQSAMREMGGLLPTMGSLKIEVLETSYE